MKEIPGKVRLLEGLDFAGGPLLALSTETNRVRVVVSKSSRALQGQKKCSFALPHRVRFFLPPESWEWLSELFVSKSYMILILVQMAI